MEYFVCVLSFILSISSPSCSSVAISLIFRRRFLWGSHEAPLGYFDMLLLSGPPRRPPELVDYFMPKCANISLGGWRQSCSGA